MANKNKKKSDQRPASPPALSFLAWPVFITLSFFIFREYFSKFKPDINSLITVFSPSQYFSQGIFRGLGHAFVLMLQGLFSFTGIFGWGYLVLKKIKIEEKPVPSIVLSFAAGILFTALFSAVMGWGGLLKREFFLIFASIGTVLFLWAAFMERSNAEEYYPESFARFPLFWLFLFCAAAVNLIQSLSPETFYDTIIYHLAVPNFWKIEGKIKDMPYLIFSKMPFNHGLVYLYCLETGSAASAKVVNWFISIFTLFSFFAFFKGRFSDRTLFGAAAVFFSIFHYMNVSWYASNDAMLTFFILCSFYLSMRYSENLSARTAAMAGLMAGFAMGIKYTSAIFVLGIFISLFWSMRGRFSAFLRFLILFGLFACVPVLPWLIKNFLIYGNPFYPMLYKIFQKNISPFDASLINSFMKEVKQFDFNFKDWLMHPLNVSAGKIANDEYFTPVFALLLPMAFFNRKENALVKTMMIYFLTCWLLWSFSSNVVRYLMPAWFAASILVSYYAFEAFDGLFAGVLKYVLLFTAALSFYWSLLFFYMEGKWRVFFGIIKADEYLSVSQPRYPWPSYGVFQHVKSVAGDGEKTLFLGDSKTLYFEKPYEASSVFDRNILNDICLSSKGPEEIYLALKARGITRIIFNIKEAMRNNAAYGIFYFDGPSMDRFNSFFDRHMKEEYSYDETQNGQIINRVIVYSLVEKTDRPAFNYIRDVYNKTGRKNELP